MYNIGLDSHNNYPVELNEIINDIKEKKDILDDSIGDQPWFY